MLGALCDISLYKHHVIKLLKDRGGMKMGRKGTLRKRNRPSDSRYIHSREYFRVENRIYKARRWPVYECLINPSWKESGLANILLSRQQPDGNIVFGAYLVDLFCLGLKDTFCNANFTLSMYEKELTSRIYQEGAPIDCQISLAHQIIYGAIEYASKLGFKPQKDFEMSKYILEEQNKIEESVSIEFGKDGKPFFIAGPNDDVELIIKKLERNAGKGNFSFIIGEPI